MPAIMKEVYLRKIKDHPFYCIKNMGKRNVLNLIDFRWAFVFISFQTVQVSVSNLEMLSTNNVSYIELAITCYTLTGTQKDPLVEKLLIRSPAISDDHKIYTKDSEKSMLQKFHTWTPKEHRSQYDFQNEKNFSPALKKDYQFCEDIEGTRGIS